MNIQRCEFWYWDQTQSTVIDLFSGLRYKWLSSKPKILVSGLKYLHMIGYTTYTRMGGFHFGTKFKTTPKNLMQWFGHFYRAHLLYTFYPIAVQSGEALNATWHSTTPAVKPVSNDRQYYFLPYWDEKPTMWIRATFPDHRRRLYHSNVIGKIVDKLVNNFYLIRI